MITLKVKEICALREIDTAYQLKKLCGLSPTIAQALFDGELKRYSAETLDKLCWGLECQVGDLLIYVAEKNRKKPIKLKLKRGRPRKNVI